MDLLHYVDQVFSKDGILVQMGGRHTAEQHEYAKYIANSILNRSFTLSFLEAETGIGKSLGYLVPILINIALHQNSDKPIGKYVISTFTRQLQKQITNGDIKLVNEIIQQLGFDNHILAAYRMGKQAFFSIERTKNCCMRVMAVEPHREVELTKFVHWIELHCEFGSGLWADYNEEFGCLPKGIKQQDICLLNKQNIDNKAYLHHLERAKEADVIITNHMSTLMNKYTGLSDLNIEAIIFDEAHKISDLCAELFNHHTSINEIGNVLARAEKYLGKRSLKVSLEQLDKLNNLIQAHPQFNTIGYICESNSLDNFLQIKSQVKQLHNAVDKVFKKFESSFEQPKLQLEDVEFHSDLESTLLALKSWHSENPSDFKLSAVSISKIQKRISLATMNIFGSRLFASIAKKLTSKVILTSATLSDVKASKGFQFIQKDLGFSKESISFECSLAPSVYGQMNFVLTDRSVPKPIVTDEESECVSFNPLWLKNTLNMINEARTNDEPLLILTVSHYETLVIAEALKDQDSVLVHKASSSLNEIVPDFINNPQYNVLITSAGWEGLNLRTAEGKQLIKNIVLTRIPFIPPQPLHEFLVNAFIKLNGGKKFSEQNLNIYNNLKKVIPTLKQGFGRGVRSPEDEITIWIADPRMPRSSYDQLSILLNAVPKRFLSNYNQARIFGQTKKEVIFI